MYTGILDSGMQGVQAGQNSLAKNAEKVSQFGVRNDDLVTPMVGMIQDTTQVNASLAVIKTGDEMTGALLNIRA